MNLSRRPIGTIISGGMAKKPAQPPEPAPEAEELPPEEIRRRMERALRRAFTLPHKPQTSRNKNQKPSC